MKTPKLEINVKNIHDLSTQASNRGHEYFKTTLKQNTGRRVKENVRHSSCAAAKQFRTNIPTHTHTFIILQPRTWGFVHTHGKQNIPPEHKILFPATGKTETGSKRGRAIRLRSGWYEQSGTTPHEQRRGRRERAIKDKGIKRERVKGGGKEEEENEWGRVRENGEWKGKGRRRLRMNDKLQYYAHEETQIK